MSAEEINAEVTPNEKRSRFTHTRHVNNTRENDTDFLCFVERVYVLQRGIEEVAWWVAIDHGQVLASLQVAAGCLWRLLCLLYFLLAVLLLDDPLDLRQRLRSEAAERVDACGREHACHLGIAKRRHLKGLSPHRAPEREQQRYGKPYQDSFIKFDSKYITFSLTIRFLMDNFKYSLMFYIKTKEIIQKNHSITAQQVKQKNCFTHSDQKDDLVKNDS